MKRNKRFWTRWNASLSVMLTVVALLGSGCLFTGRDQSPNTPDPWVNTIEVLARNASCIGAQWDLKDHPEHAAAYAAAAAGLKGLVAKEDYDPANFAKILQSLPALKGDQGALLVSGGLAVYGLVAGFIDLTTAPRVAAAMRGTLYGLEQATAPRTTLRPARGMTATDPPLPPQLTVPQR